MLAVAAMSLALLLLVIAPIRAADAPIDLAAALDRALADGIDAEEAALARTAAASTLSRQKQAGFPALGGWAAASAGTAQGPEASAGLSADMTLYGGGSIRAGVARARAQLAAAEAGVERMQQDLHLALATTMLELAAARAQVVAAGSTLAAEEALEKRIRSGVDVGARTRADALQQTAAAARARSALVAAERIAALTELSLIQTLRLDPRRDWPFAPPTRGPELDVGGVDALLVRADAELPELAVLRCGVEAADAEVVTARAGGLPSVGLGLDAGSSLAADGGAAAGTQFTDNVAATASVGITVPIYGRGATRDAVAQATIARDRAALALASGRESAAIQVRAALIDLRAAAASLDAARARDEASAAAVVVVRDRYEAGAAVLSELLTARADLADAQRARIAADAEELRARFALAWAVGGL